MEMKEKAAEKGITRSLLCLFPTGDTPFSVRLFDAIVSGCILVVVSDKLELPFEGLLNYRKVVSGYFSDVDGLMAMLLCFMVHRLFTEASRYGYYTLVLCPYQIDAILPTSGPCSLQALHNKIIAPEASQQEINVETSDMFQHYDEEMVGNGDPHTIFFHLPDELGSMHDLQFYLLDDSAKIINVMSQTLRYLEEFLGPILFFWTACGVSLAALVELVIIYHAFRSKILALSTARSIVGDPGFRKCFFFFTRTSNSCFSRDTISRAVQTVEILSGNECGLMIDRIVVFHPERVFIVKFSFAEDFHDIAMRMPSSGMPVNIWPCLKSFQLFLVVLKFFNTIASCLLDLFKSNPVKEIVRVLAR
ncbi:unnamed protein product [Arabis nemorensis]|uniref:Exostosin GT47 domain-containing protein n=1 Tax=Arabis nemorensis TaxID=586526 RepID=A0A565B9B0_9BRAS|nr:unnamed protein product [Arabis nemorensis]